MPSSVSFAPVFAIDSQPFSPTSLSPPKSLPRPPRCLTPYPSQRQFPISSRSPLSSPESPSQTNATHSPTRPSTPGPHILTASSPRAPSGPGSQLRPPREKSPKRSIPITLRMSSLSPTDSSFPTNQPIYLSPSPGGRMGYRIPLSPSVKQYMEDKENKRRPEPIIIHRHSRARGSGGTAIRSPTLTARPDNPNLEPDGPVTSGMGADLHGSVPFPKTPDLVSAKTAMPLTAKRIGKKGTKRIRPKHEQESNEQEGCIEIILRSDAGEEVPMLRGEPSPGWAQL